MKLLLCKKCGDVFNLNMSKKSCSCGETCGQYNDSLYAEISGPCIPIGFANSSFLNAIRVRPHSGIGAEFVAFVIPEQCETITSKD